MSSSSSSIIEKIDLHIHTSFSDGEYTVDEAVKIAEKKGLKVVAITDHYSEVHPHLKRIKRSNFSKYLQTLERFNVIKGVEVEILQDGTISISKTKLEELDLVIGGLHSINNIKFWGDSTPIWDTKRFVENVRVVLIKAIETGLLDVIAHVSWLPKMLRKVTQNIIADDWIKSIVDTCCDWGVAIEINCAWRVPDERFITHSIKKGVKLSIGSDAHQRSMIGKTDYAVDLFNKMKIPENYLFIPSPLF